MKICRKCKITKEDSDFYRNAGKPDGLQGYCKSCHRAAVAASFQLHKAAVARRVRQAALHKRQILLDYLSKQACVDCGNADIRVLEFDHRGDKVGTPSILIWRRRVSVERLLAELAKCDIRCANCHRIKTCKERGWRSPRALAA